PVVTAYVSSSAPPNSPSDPAQMAVTSTPMRGGSPSSCGMRLAMLSNVGDTQSGSHPTSSSADPVEHFRVHPVPPVAGQVEQVDPHRFVEDLPDPHRKREASDDVVEARVLSPYPDRVEFCGDAVSG